MLSQHSPASRYMKLLAACAACACILSACGRKEVTDPVAVSVLILLYVLVAIGLTLGAVLVSGHLADGHGSPLRKLLASLCMLAGIGIYVGSYFLFWKLPADIAPGSVGAVSGIIGVLSIGIGYLFYSPLAFVYGLYLVALGVIRSDPDPLVKGLLYAGLGIIPFGLVARFFGPRAVGILIIFFKD